MTFPIVVGAACGALLLSSGCTLPMARDVVVWVAPEDEPIAPDSPPVGENEIYSRSRGEVALTAAVNETVALQLVLRTASPPAGPLDVVIGDFVGGSGRLTAREHVRRYRAHYVRVEEFRAWYPSHTGQPAQPTLFPDKLVPWEAERGGGPMLLAEARNELVWIDVRVPPTVAPGAYTSRLEVRLAGTPQVVFACAVKLDVLPVALPGRRSLAMICRLDPRDLLEKHLRWPRVRAAETALVPQQPAHLTALRLVRSTMALFQVHRTEPILWGSFPKYRIVGPRQVEVDWAAYDALVGPWLDGTAFEDRVRLEHWPIPAARDYPDAEHNGGLGSPEYARLLAAYLVECQRHFLERGWSDRALLRLCPPAALTQRLVDDLRAVAGIVQQSETALSLVAHLPVQSLSALGWEDTPRIDVEPVAIWAPPAMWFEPDAMARQQTLGKRTWLMPDYPPYSGSLAVEAPPTDARALAWQAYRYGCDAVWIEHAAEFATPRQANPLHPWQAPGLIYPGDDYGMLDEAVPSIRLKRLRRGVQDYELLRLLEENGKRLLARSLAEQVVRWAGTDACVQNLLSCRPAGWPRAARIFRRARQLMLQELVREFEPDELSPQHQIAALTEWGLMMNRADRISATVEGVRLTRTESGLRAAVQTTVLNTTNHLLEGRWSLPAPPQGWSRPAEVPVRVGPNGRQAARLELELGGFAYNAAGVYPFALELLTGARERHAVPARLAVAACPTLRNPPTIDGKLDDWPLATNNAAGDFQLCRPVERPGEEVGWQPRVGTQAFFAMDREQLYVGVRCAVKSGETPVWRADNVIPVDGATPWGQDVVEILIDPRVSGLGNSGDVYCVQVKPSGHLEARRGCRTVPPMGRTQVWTSGARAAVTVEREVWVVELAIPLSAFEPSARRAVVWGLNVTRLDARRGEYSSWSGARGFVYEPASLGNLLMLWE